MSLLPPQEDRSYGFFGYRGYVCDLAIRRDDPEMMRELIEREFIDKDCEMLGGGDRPAALREGGAEVRGCVA